MKQLLLFFLLFIGIPTYAQTSLGIEAQAYPAGVVPGLRFDLGISETLTLTSRIGYNFTDRRDWGEHDNEEGGGPGFSLGFERTGFLTEKLSVYARTDLWFMDIDWRDTQYICPVAPPCGNIESAGATNITVLQPTLGIGYSFPLSGNYFVKPSLSFGYEINVKTDGEDVGQGPILLAGFQLGRLHQ
ncbi:MAG: hypothetical protein JJ971_05505 [Balneolaceae bacterium]|nr:hypothetical protein [Balneolaceae bacterium]MBO6545833.1 hypothetical protein [Balneolaceae bacterium]MBO6647229.1 hypothetical protein [Balneolaceae bacterium]